jgi:acyl carrier protein
MTADSRERVQKIFRDVFDEPGLVLQDEMTAADVDGWDSFAHINLIIAIERQLQIKFTTGEIAQLKEPGNNVGTFLQFIEKKLQKAAG